ncbi:uncharacterized protein LOC129231212 [Uloborus diversus]|uniref:uncharacterized protein LOC129231212 n=1 Tax=Uloborus diversus TaxID=327109 RepID=UPI00240A2966|nr:uncharacterized protein LOC129231212 [Uloborus diversus]
MKRKRDKINGQASKKLKATPSSDVFRLKVASKLSALLNTSLKELGEKTESLATSSELREVHRLPLLSGRVKPESSSEQEDIDPLTKSLLNFIDSAKSRLSELFKKDNEVVYAKKFGVDKEDLLTCKNKNCSKVCTSVDQDSLQAQISEKFQSLFKKALNSNGLSQNVHEVEQTETEVQIIDEEWQDVSLLLDDFLKSARKKVNDLLSTKSDTERNNKCIGASGPATKPLHKKLSYIPNSKCSKSGKHLGCDRAGNVTHVIDNATARKADLNGSTQIPVLTHTSEKSLKSPKTVSFDSSSSVSCLLDKPSVRNTSSYNCATNCDQEFVHDLTVKSLKTANPKCVETQHINLENTPALESSFSESNRVHSRTLRSCSLRRLTIKPKSTKSSTTEQDTLQNQIPRKISTHLNSTRTTVHNTKCKSSVVKSFDITPVDPSASLKKANTVAMEFGIPYESNSFEDPSNYEFESLDYGTGSGILLMDEAEHAPDVLNLEVVIDEGNNSDESSSEPEVLCLGEKVPTYEVVTIEEDDEAAQVASAEVVPASSTGSENLSEEKSFECPHCGKSYKVESLLKFHVRMHVSSVVQDQSTVGEDKAPTSQEGRSQEKKKTQRTKKLAPEKESSGAEIKLQKKKQARRHKSRHSS